MVSFLAPARLAGLAVPAILLGWMVVRRRWAGRDAARFSSLALIDRAVPSRPGWRRTVVAAAVVAGLVVLAAAFARPVVAVPVPRDVSVIVLAIDVSLSMGADDVAPSRLAAAQAAAGRFLEDAPDSLGVGLVAFAGTVLPVAGPEVGRAVVEEAVRRLALGEGTAIGEAIFTGLDLITRGDLPEPEDGAPPAALIVLTDGESTIGRPESEAAAAAAGAGIPVFTVAFGTEAGSVEVEGEQVPVPVNEGVLRAVAETTGGEFFGAGTEAELSEVLDRVGSQIAYRTAEREVTDWFAAAGLVLVGLAAAGSLRWFGRLA